MNRRFFIVTLTAASLSAGFASAASYQDSVVAQLRGAGYRQISVENTWLGRVRIRAIKGKELREIVLNPRTGEVLRDVVHLQSDTSGRGSNSGRSSDAGSSGNSGSGSAGSDDDGSDDDGSDDGDDSDDDSGDDNSSDDDDKDDTPEKDDSPDKDDD